MKGFRLTDAQIRQRLQEGRNYKRLYFELKVKYDAVVLENKQLKQELIDQRRHFEAIIESQGARIEELEKLVFGRKKRPRSGGGRTASTQPRDAASYRRPIPNDDEVTHVEYHAINACHHCGGPLTDKEEHIRFVEDIILAALAMVAQFKTVTKHVVERGYCVSCGIYSSAYDLRGQQVAIGPYVRMLVCYLVTLRDHSYDQVRNILWDVYRFDITNGEIAVILAVARVKLLPEYNRLKDSIRAGPAVHMDESRYRIQSEGGAGYGFSMSSAVNSDVVFKLAESRGKAHAKELIGEHYSGVGITDRYGAYKHLFENEDGSSRHQICWAHLQRTAKDLTHLECLSKTKLTHVTRFYQALASIYATIRAYQTELFDADTRRAQANKLLKQTKRLCQPHELDPKKLAALKAGILEYQDSLFLRLTIDGVPVDNNRAERDIRKLVIKRRKSLGSKTPKGAGVLEVLLSVCWSLYNRDKNNFFPNLQAMLTRS